MRQLLADLYVTQSVDLEAVFIEVANHLRVGIGRVRVVEPGGSVRGERAIFTRLVLGCIEASKQASKVEQSLSEAKFCK